MLGAMVTAATARAATIPAALGDQRSQCGAAGAPQGHGQPGEATSWDAWGELDSVAPLTSQIICAHWKVASFCTGWYGTPSSGWEHPGWELWDVCCSYQSSLVPSQCPENTEHGVGRGAADALVHHPSSPGCGATAARAWAQLWARVLPCRGKHQPLAGPEQRWPPGLISCPISSSRR